MRPYDVLFHDLNRARQEWERTFDSISDLVTIDVTMLRAVQDLEKEYAVQLASEQSATNTIQAMSEGVALLEADGTIISVNPAAERMTGIAAADSVGRPLGDLLPDILKGAHLAAAQRGLDILRAGRVPELPPLCIRRPDGVSCHVLPGVSVVDMPKDGGRRTAVLTFKDVSDLHQATERLRDLAERLARTGEKERWRIARYIHDTIIQNLSLASIRMDTMTAALTGAGRKEEADKLHQMRALLDQAIDECRLVMSDLTPTLLYELGLIPALYDLARRLEAKSETRVIVEDDGQEAPMSNALRRTLYESVREFAVNALKHAAAGEIRVKVSGRDNEHVVSVTDNGKGFDPRSKSKQSPRKGGFGLFSIRHRIERLGGRLEIESACGRGTTATVAVPVEAEPDAG
jgi:two-component system, NarL family, sensor histidine kinase UhpB